MKDNLVLVKAEDLRPGMVLDTWFGQRQIARIDLYNGPFSFIVGILVFRGTHSDMSLEKGMIYHIVP